MTTTHEFSFSRHVIVDANPPFWCLLLQPGHSPSVLNQKCCCWPLFSNCVYYRRWRCSGAKRSRRFFSEFFKLLGRAWLREVAMALVARQKVKYNWCVVCFVYLMAMERRQQLLPLQRIVRTVTRRCNAQRGQAVFAETTLPAIDFVGCHFTNVFPSQRLYYSRHLLLFGKLTGSTSCFHFL